MWFCWIVWEFVSISRGRDGDGRGMVEVCGFGAGVGGYGKAVHRKVGCGYGSLWLASYVGERSTRMTCCDSCRRMVTVAIGSAGL